MGSHPHGYILRTFPLTLPIFHQGSGSALPLLRGAIMCEPAVSFLADWLTGRDRGARIDAGDDGPPSAASTLLLITGQRGRVAMLLARMAVAISQP